MGEMMGIEAGGLLKAQAVARHWMEPAETTRGRAQPCIIQWDARGESNFLVGQTTRRGVISQRPLLYRRDKGRRRD